MEQGAWGTWDRSPLSHLLSRCDGHRLAECPSPSVPPNKLCSLPHWPLLAAMEAGKWSFLAGPKRVFVTKVNGRQDIVSLCHRVQQSPVRPKVKSISFSRFCDCFKPNSQTG